MKTRTRKTPFLLLLLSLLLLVIGLNKGEASAVLEKGIKVCLSCIGIG